MIPFLDVETGTVKFVHIHTADRGCEQIVF